ncbi:MAG: L,D-transpeptidase [Firmicutes bacterium]|nr:L,D-transpeptidase [Bacillota bacterium]
MYKMSANVLRNIKENRTKTAKVLLSVLIVIVMTVTVLACIGYRAEDASASSGKYWLKVNRLANVVTAYKYKDGKYVPYRAMLCSSGGPNTPKGTFHTLKKYRWKVLMGPVYGQYNTRIYKHYLFHSVWYYNNHNKATCTTQEYNLLGHSRSHGCVRLSVMDAKWIYENCKLGTKVTVYESSNPGPLGKPKGFKIYGGMAWDPTDPDPDNPDFRLRKPVLTIGKKKAKSVEYGKKYYLLRDVKAKDVNAYQDLTDWVKVSKVRKRVDGKWVKAKFSTKSIGKYKITYSCHYKYCRGTTKKSFTVRVKDSSRPTLKAPKTRTVNFDTVNAVRNVSAKVKSGNRTNAIKVRIKSPSGKVMRMSYKRAKKFRFNWQGTYRIRYKVKSIDCNKYAVKYTKVICWRDAKIKVLTTKIHVTDADNAAAVKKLIRENTVIHEKRRDYRAVNKTVNITLNKTAPFKAGTTITATLKYKGANNRTVTKKVYLTVEASTSSEPPEPPAPDDTGGDSGNGDTGNDVQP